MCSDCWKNFYEGAQIDNERVREAAAAIAEVYEYSMVGGCLHVQIDDWNLDGNDWPESIDKWLGHLCEPEAVEERAAEDRCYALLRAMTEEERASALALHDGFWEVEA